MLYEEPVLGHSYVTLRGDIVKIIGRKLSMHPYQGSNGRWYNRDGRTDHFRDQPNDLHQMIDIPVYVRTSIPTETVQYDTGHLAVSAIASLALEAFRAFRRRR